MPFSDLFSSPESEFAAAAVFCFLAAGFSALEDLPFFSGFFNSNI